MPEVASSAKECRAHDCQRQKALAGYIYLQGLYKLIKGKKIEKVMDIVITTIMYRI